jgi:hypothetical protein
MTRGFRAVALAALLYPVAPAALADVPVPVPQPQRGRSDAERSGFHDAANIRTLYWNFGMVGDYPADPGNVDLSVFHSVEVPSGTGMNYSDGITPFVLAKDPGGGPPGLCVHHGDRVPRAAADQPALQPGHALRAAAPAISRPIRS